MNTDQNLLFGVLALQADLIDNSRFAEVCAAWAARKDAPLSELLLERGWISTADRDDIEKLLQRKLNKHGGDARASLADVSNAEAVRALALLNDPAINESLAQLSLHEGQITVSTLTTIPEPGERYTRTGLHGEGGIGRVWKAYDRQLGRSIALKDLKPERANHPVHVARFLVEAQITAQLEHPGIVPVYELIKPKDNDSPYYMMRFIKGRTLSQAIREFHQHQQIRRAMPTLQLRELLQAFVMVCNTLAYAHSRGVIHRDLKGSNIILGPYGEVLILDWGLARTLDSKTEVHDEPPVELATAEWDYSTLPGQVMGTPSYMAPEQAEGRIDLMDQRTDIYGLGAVLYEILTNQPPFTGKDAAEVLRHVREDHPLPPRRLNAAVPKPLEAVCLKALARKPDDRYASALELAEEVKRWVADEPVAAWPEPWPLRLRRWVRRHRTLATALTATLLMALVLIGGGWIWREQERADRQTRVTKELTQAQTLWQEAKTAEPNQRQDLWTRALAAAERADSLLAEGGIGAELADQIQTLLDELRDEARNRKLVMRLEEARLLRTALKEGNLDRAATDAAYSKAFAECGIDILKTDLKEAAATIRNSTIREELIAALDDWSLNKEAQDKEKNNKEAHRLLKLARAADDNRRRNQLRDAWLAKDAQALKKIATTPEVNSFSAQTLVLLGQALLSQGDGKEAKVLLRQAHQRHPNDFWINNALGIILAESQPPNLDEALRFFTAALALRPQSSMAHVNLGLMLGNQRRFDEALLYFQKAIELQDDVGMAYNNLGWVLNEKGQFDEAIPYLRKAIKLKPDLALAHSNLGGALLSKEHFDEAIPHLRQALELNPDLAEAHTNLGWALLEKGRFDDAVTHLRQALELKPDFALAHSNLAAALNQKERFDEAIGSARKAIDLQPNLFQAHHNLGLALVKKERFDEAIPPLQKAIDLKPDFALAHSNLAAALNGKGCHNEAIRAARKAIDLKPDLFLAHGSLGLALASQQQSDEALSSFQESIKLRPDWAEPHRYVSQLFLHKGQFAKAHTAMKRYHELLKDNDQQRHYAAQRLGLLQEFMALEGKLSAITDGTLKPANDEQRMLFAWLCRHKQHFAASVRLWKEVFANQPHVSHYDAACAAVLAAAGKGKDTDALTEKDRHAWREQALQWLRTDLGRGKNQINKAPAHVQQLLRSWQRDPDLASVRDADALAKLPADERERWRQLWADVERLLKMTRRQGDRVTR